MLPRKTYFTTSCALYESNLDPSGVVNPRRIAEFMQDAAGLHADILGFGWDNLDATGCLWVLSKLKLRFYKPLTKDIKGFNLYTWPLKPQRFFAERCFEALDVNGEQLFGATTMWMVIDRNSRKAVSSDRLAEIYRCDFDDAHCDVEPQFERVRRDESYEFVYDKTVRRSDLDVNGHVNNTNYINFALDALQPHERVCELEIVYHKELLLGDVAHVYCKRDGNAVYLVGERDETTFTAKLVLATGE